MAPFYKFTICSLTVLFIYVEYVRGANGNRCYDCRSGVNGVHNPQCPKYDTVDDEKAFKQPCDGHCFTKSDAKNEELIVRGCTDKLYGLPNPLPPDDGCYLHNSDVWCVCNSDLCNYGAISENATVKMDAHLEGVTLGPGEEKKCYVCANYDYQGNLNSYCPKNDSVNSLKTWKVNCTKHCFTRTDFKDTKMIFRGCSDSQPGLPNPLPSDGCYAHNQQVWCVCSTNLCNYGPIVSENVTVRLDVNVSHIPVDNGVTLGPGEEKKCHVCINYDDKGNYYRHCPKNDFVNPEKTWKANCTGLCFTRTDDIDDRLIYRGCTDALWNFPDPAPPDGCYTYYLETWCICSTHLCNFGPIGKGEIEMDAHITNGCESSVCTVSLYLVCVCIVQFLFTK